MESYERVFNALNNKEVDRPPVFPQIGDHAGIIFGYSYRDMYKSATKAAEAHQKAMELYGYDIATIQVEPSWPVAEACGAEVTYPTDKNPWITKHPIQSIDSIEILEIPDFRLTLSSNVMIEGTKILTQEIELPVAAFMTGPLTFSFQLMPYKKMLKCILKAPSIAKKVLSKATTIIKAYIKNLKEAGANICVICEHDLQMIAPIFGKKYCLEYLSEVFSIYKYNILHMCGKIQPHLELFSQDPDKLKGLDCINIGPYIDITETQKLFNSRIGIAGNIDHYKLLPHGTPKEIESAVHKAIAASRGDQRFMVAPGCEITTDTPIENVKAFVNAANTYEN